MRLIEIQRRLAAALTSPRARGAAGLIAPNALLSPRERLDIYRRSYWCRLLDSLREDFPGLAFILGRRALDRLFRAYLADCPSRSFTLRDLGAGLEAWLRGQPRFAWGNRPLAVEMVRLEWAHIQAFDGPAEASLSAARVGELSGDARLGLQPHIALLHLRYPVDDIRLRSHSRRRRALKLPPAKSPVFLAVHRQDHTVYYRRLAREEFLILSELRAGRPLERAIRKDVPPDLLSQWFAAWAGLGWLTDGRLEKGTWE